MGSALDSIPFISTDSPDYYAPSASPAQREAIDRITQGALQSTAESEAQGFRPVQAKGLMGPDDGSAFNKSLGMNDATLSAIRARSGRKLQDSQSKLDLDTKKMARAAYSEKLAHAAKLASDEAQANFDKEMMKRDAKNQKSQARAQAIGSILGVTAQVIGAGMGGGG